MTEKVSKKDRKQLAIAARDRRFIVRFTIGAIVAVVVGALFYVNSQRYTYPAAVDAHIGYQAVLRSYIARHQQPDKAWLTGREDMFQEMTLIHSWANRLREQMDRYKDVSPLARRVHHFRGFRVSKFTNGVSHSLIPPLPDADIEAMLIREAGQLEVCMMTPVQRNHPSLLPNSLYYRSEWGAVMVDSVQWTDTFLAALAYHEMGHALRHQVDRAPSATAPGDSDLWIGEEVEMHELEHQVLDAAVQGRFNQLLDGIIDRTPAAATPVLEYRALADTISREDWQAFDNLFGLQGAGKRTTSIHCAQFLISLGFRYIERNTPEADRRRRQIEFYRFMATLSQ